MPYTYEKAHAILDWGWGITVEDRLIEKIDARSRTKKANRGKFEKKKSNLFKHRVTKHRVTSSYGESSDDDGDSNKTALDKARKKR